MTSKPKRVTCNVDGACRGNGTEAAISAIGVYFSAGSEHNASKVIEDASPTSSRAELAAGIHALERAYIILSTEDIDVVHIEADSVYLVKGVGEWMPKWKVNGWKASDQRDVKNRDYWNRIDELISCVQATGKGVGFGHVPRAENKEADALAN